MEAKLSAALIENGKLQQDLVEKTKIIGDSMPLN
jgi:hypothetical protein